ncbi:GNAT family N-acetyltransferase [Tropicimonas sp. IMCC34043]|uniref:GNAT family N-acetyltransferase n=1 Tax=Tropicimonas sp. IMCC34043 TaxID=2248760 RepID=UPI000E2493C5|nr:GNAT family N-acetyltransferase [Tropicimonas sp. IMCC34043]
MDCRSDLTLTDLRPPEPSIRPVQWADIPRLAEMIAALAAHHGDTPALDRATLRRDVLGDAPWITVLVAESDGALVGYAALLPLAQLQAGARGMDLHHLYVESGWRGRGLGRRLIEAAKAQAAGRGCGYLTVGTDPANHAAQAVYPCCGFEVQASPGPRFRMSLKPETAVA